MVVVPKHTSLELALKLLRSGPLNGQEICSKVLSLSNVSEKMAQRLARTMLAEDPRFRCLSDGRWAIAENWQTDPEQSLIDTVFVVVDVETTGFSPPSDRVIEIGMVRVAGGRIIDSYETLINPRRPVPRGITGLTGIEGEMLRDCPTFTQVCEEVVCFLGDAVFVAHNAPFDWRFMQSEISLASGKEMLNRRLCTRSLAARLLPELKRRSLDQLAYFFNLSFPARHRALGDALVTAELLLRFLDRADEKGVNTLSGLFELLKPRGLRKSKS